MEIKDRLTIAEASEFTGLSKRALARRIERGQLRATKDGGLRYVEPQELARAGLLDLATGKPPAWAQTRLDPEVLVREVIETLNRRGIEIYELRRELENMRAEFRQEIEHARRERGDLRRRLDRAGREDESAD